MKDKIHLEKQFSLREKLVVIICVFLIQMIEPFEYSHQFTKFWEEIKGTMNSKE